MMPVQACCICGKAFTGHGKDPMPVVNDPGARCCDDCNSRVVLPTRLERVREHNKTKREGSNGGAVSMIDLNDIEEDSFFAIQAADLRWLYDLWAQLADEKRPLDRQAIVKRLGVVLENAEFF